jgi:DNA-binding NarL/FixJ family response regulator
MFRFLITDDEEGTSELLQEHLSEQIPEAQVECALTVKEAHRLIEEAYNSRELYDAVVLDINLPKDAGHFPEFDESVCHDIKDLMPKTIVAHISAYLDEEIVQKHIKRVHDEEIDRSFRLSKRDVEYFLKLSSKLRTFLYGIRIQNQMDKLFGQDDEPAFSSRNRRQRASAGDERSVTHELAALSRNIAANWDDLDESLRARVKRTFEVTPKDDGVIVSFF